MIAAADFEAYARAVDAIVQAASDFVERGVLEWAAANPSAPTARAREAAKEIMAQAGEVYGQAAATLAAEWYDERAEAAHAKLPSAVTEAVYDEKLADSTARYQARKYAAGDVAGFAASCAVLARDQARRCVNGTVMANVERDSEKGARFARVPVGATTCAFCLMLASRGAVYSSRRTAGEGNRYHRNCDCKVVPSWEADPMATLVEGHDPWEYYDRWKHPEKYAQDDGHSRSSVGAVYSGIYAARDAEVAKAKLDNLRQTQLIHMAGSMQSLKTTKDRGIEPSCFTVSLEELRALIKKHAGHGEPDNLYGYEWNRKEICTADHVVGYIISRNGDKIPTRSFKIHYSNDGVHAVPRYDEGGLPDDV